MNKAHEILDSLDDITLRNRLDPRDLMDLIVRFPQQCRDAAGFNWNWDQSSVSPEKIKQVVLTGVGGSAIGGDFAQCLMNAYGTVPLIVNRDYTLPVWVSPDTLVMAASYSGNTEETLAAYEAAGMAGAQRAVITSGGKLLELAKKDAIPYVIVPGGQPPRTATGYMFFPMMEHLARRKLLGCDFSKDIKETILLLESQALRYGLSVPTAQNPAKQLAAALYEKIPVVYGTQSYGGAVAYRWKSHFNENNKIFALSNALPEQNHNEILAYTLGCRQAQNWAVIVLRDAAEERERPRSKHRTEVTEQLIGEEAEKFVVWSEGESLLERMFSLIYFADFLTIYLAYLYEICPTEIRGIDILKQAMSEK